MKKVILITILLIASQLTWAQYCGNSGSGQCNVSGNVTQPGLSPMSDSLPPFENNVQSTTVIQFRNFNQVFFGGTAFTLQSLTLDTIDNLPSGLCWATNKANNTYANSENGCIRVNGVPCDSTGQYEIRIIATVTTSAPVVITTQVNAAAVGLHYYVRLINSGDTVPPVDTTALTNFIPYGDTCHPTLPPTVELDTSEIFCQTSTINLAPVVTNGQPPLSYLWETLSGDTVECDTCLNTTLVLNQHTSLRFTVTDAFNRTATDTVNYYSAGFGADFNIFSSGPPSVCTPDSVVLNAHTNFGFSIVWKRDTTTLFDYFNDSTLVITDTSGTYHVLFTGGGCTANSNNIVVSINPSPTVSVSPTGPVNICQGSNTTLQSTATPGVSYLWQLNGNNLNSATNATYTASLGGTYRLVVKTAANCPDTSNAVVVNVHPLPTVTLSGNPDTVCTTSTITLSGASPSGGTFNGIGVTGNTFSASTAGTGPHTISYSYTDVNNCTNAATETIVVKLCTGIEDVSTENDMVLFPNPVNDMLFVQSKLLTEPNATFTVVDVTGNKIVCDYKMTDKGVNIKTNALPKGVYFVRMESHGREYSRKFVKAD